jgi:hypothetical protein
VQSALFDLAVIIPIVGEQSSRQTRCVIAAMELFVICLILFTWCGFLSLLWKPYGVTVWHQRGNHDKPETNRARKTRLAKCLMAAQWMLVFLPTDDAERDEQFWLSLAVSCYKPKKLIWEYLHPTDTIASKHYKDLYNRVAKLLGLDELEVVPTATQLRRLLGNFQFALDAHAEQAGF